MTNENLEVLAYVIKDDNGVYHVEDAATGEIGPECKICSDERTIALTPNAANRKWIKIVTVENGIAAEGKFGMTYKASHPIGSIGNRMPNAKLIEYLSDEDKAEYEAIVKRAKEAYLADKKKPLTDLEKAQAALERAQAKYTALAAKANK